MLLIRPKATGVKSYSEVFINYYLRISGLFWQNSSHMNPDQTAILSRPGLWTVTVFSEHIISKSTKTTIIDMVPAVGVSAEGEISPHSFQCGGEPIF